VRLDEVGGGTRLASHPMISTAHPLSGSPSGLAATTRGTTAAARTPGARTPGVPTAADHVRSPIGHAARRVGLAVATTLVLVACTGGDATTMPAATSTPTGNVLAEDGEIGATDTPRAVPSPPALHPSVDDYPAGRVVVDPGDGAALLPVVVRVADDSQRRSHGLMEVEEVPDGVGMWFTYDEDHTGGFWMKGTRTDLDIAWVDDRGRIVAIETMIVCEADPCPSYDPGAAYRTALEVRSGWYADNGVEVGDRILRDSA